MGDEISMIYYMEMFPEARDKHRELVIQKAEVDVVS